MKKFTYFAAILLMAINGFAQHFVVAYSGNGQDHMNINVVTATIGGVALKAGDEIAAFDGAICCGVKILDKPIVITIPSTFAIIAASRKDDGQSNGYTVGHAITYKFWDSGRSMEFSGISAEYFDNTGATTTAPTYTINASAFVRLTVAAPANQAPVPNAGPDQSVNEGDNVALDGSGSSDADSNPLTYTWSAPAGITLSSTSVAKPTFTAPNVTTDTQYTFSLVVNDGLVNSGTDQVLITVKKVNLIPLANAGADQTLNEGVLVTLNGTASSDPDSDPLSYLWSPPAGITLNSTTASQPTFTAPEVTSDKQYTFSLMVNDGTANSPADQVVITVKNIDKTPYVKEAIKDVSVDKRAPDQIIDLKTIFADDDIGDILSYSITSNANDQIVTAKIAGFNLTLSFSTENSGLSEIEITANSNGKEAKSKFKVQVNIPTGTDPIISEQKFIVSPNPTSGKIKVTFERIPENGTYLTVNDVTGKTILKQLIQDKEEWIDLKGNPPGIYLIKANLNNLKVQKVILK